MSIPTPHIEAKEGAFAKTVLMPGILSGQSI